MPIGDNIRYLVHCARDRCYVATGKGHREGPQRRGTEKGHREGPQRRATEKGHREGGDNEKTPLGVNLVGLACYLLSSVLPMLHGSTLH